MRDLSATSASVAQRARLHAALGDPGRLAVVDELWCSDRSPSELSVSLEMPSNLLAHHLDVLERDGLVERLVSSGDRRRRYVRLRHEPLVALAAAIVPPAAEVLFVCTQNSARSQLAAALWHDRAGTSASSAGTHPADEVHAGAAAAARRAGLDLGSARPRSLDAADLDRADLVVTVCDRAHEELPPGTDAWHWSIPDPVVAASDAAFDAALAALDERIRALL